MTSPQLTTEAAPQRLEALLAQARGALAAGELASALQSAQAALELAPVDPQALQVAWQVAMAARRWDWALLVGERWRAAAATSHTGSLPAFQACLVPMLLLHRSEAFAATLLEAHFAFGRHGLLSTLEALYLALLGKYEQSAALAAQCSEDELAIYTNAVGGAALTQITSSGWQGPLVQAFLLHEQQQACVWLGRAKLASALQACADLRNLPWEPLRFLALGHSSEDAQIAIANRMADAWPAASPVRPPAARLQPGSGRLKIAYLSARLGAHATVVLMGCVPNFQDHAKFEIYAYGFSPPHKDKETAAGRSAELHIQGCDHVSHLPGDPAAAAAIIAADGIDVLIVMPDASMDWLATACRASGVPVIISYMSFCASTGGLAHYRIVDDSYVASEPAAREAAITLRGTYYAYSAAASGQPTRQSQGLPAGALVIAAFNAAYKISPELVQVWAQLLAQVPSAVLWLHQTHPMQAVQLQAWFAARGIAPERLVFAPDAPHTQHLARCALADIYLDAWDVGGHTSVLDALYAGVPVVTLEGPRIAQRIGANLLRQHGASEGIAANPDEYQRIALQLLQSAPARLAYRERLAQSRAQFAPFSLAQQARRLDAAINAAYGRYAQGLPPANITID